MWLACAARERAGFVTPSQPEEAREFFATNSSGVGSRSWYTTVYCAHQLVAPMHAVEHDCTVGWRPFASPLTRPFRCCWQLLLASY
jgi:hypothetical protein